MVIDFHVHLMNQNSYVNPWVTEFFDKIPRRDGHTYDSLMSMGPAELDDFLESQGVERAVGLAEVCPVTTGMFENERVIRFCRESKRLIPFCSVNPNMVARPAYELRRYVEEEGFKGLKLYPTYQQFYPNDNNIYPIYTVAEELGIPVMLHTGSSVFRGSRMKYGDPLYLDDVAVDFPGLVILLVHGGRGFWYNTATFLAQLHPNVYVEISGLPPQKLLNYFPNMERLADKFVFGSDWPGVPGISYCTQEIGKLPISDEAREKILGGNARKILKL